MQGLVNLFGIESPGLTSSLPMADEVVERCPETALKRFSVRQRADRKNYLAA